ncbi:hypothetical protein SCAR479_00655 [Seiridium cardinale]|uniref:Heterokaryon incompatibility domain-containing protein n=1 Tax=Seiridium cardinale TaxID=138064 RepID=A0ABR2YAF3_9PEZI
MRLLNVYTRSFEEYFDNNVPPYAILSHTWENEEVSFQEFHRPETTNKSGFKKIEQFCLRAIDCGLNYGWVDTCCIDKTSSAELSEAINSMFKWYERSAICFAYLADVPGNPESTFGPVFANSRWFERGWTLQELLAPPQLLMLGSNWGYIGNRDSLVEQISTITGIGTRYLTTHEAEIHYRESDKLYFHDHYSNISRLRRVRDATVAEKLSWAAARQTTRKEDIAYCLLGLCAVNMPLLYGEGTAAFIRLQEAIIRQKFDPTLLAWNVVIEGSEKRILRPQTTSSPSVWWSLGRTLLGLEDPWSHRCDKYRPLNFFCPGILATSPLCFSGCDQYVNFQASLDWDLTSRGLSIKLPTSQNRHPYMLLPCHRKNDQWNIVAVPLIGFGDGAFDRAAAPVELLDRRKWQMWPWRSLLLSTSAPAWDRIRESYCKTIRIQVASGLQVLDVAAPKHVWWLPDGLGVQWFVDKAHKRLLRLLIRSRKTDETYIVDVAVAMIKAGELRALLPESMHLQFQHLVRGAGQATKLSPLESNNMVSEEFLQSEDDHSPLLVTTSQVTSANDAEYLLSVGEPRMSHRTSTSGDQERTCAPQKDRWSIVNLRYVKESISKELGSLTDAFEAHVPHKARRLLSDLWIMVVNSLSAIFLAWGFGLLSPDHLRCDIWCWFLCARTYKLISWAGIVLAMMHRALPITCYMIPSVSHKIARHRFWLAALCVLPIFSDLVVLPSVHSGVAMLVIGGVIDFLRGPAPYAGLPHFISWPLGAAIGFSLPYLAMLLTVPDVDVSLMAAVVGLMYLWLMSTNAQECVWFPILWLYTSVFLFLPSKYTEMADCQLNPFAMLVEDGIRRYQQALYGQQSYGLRQ